MPYKFTECRLSKS